MQKNSRSLSFLFLIINISLFQFFVGSCAKTLRKQFKCTLFIFIQTCVSIYTLLFLLIRCSNSILFKIYRCSFDYFFLLIILCLFSSFPLNFHFNHLISSIMYFINTISLLFSFFKLNFIPAILFHLYKSCLSLLSFFPPSNFLSV
jgi:hypothetical protein